MRISVLLQLAVPALAIACLPRLAYAEHARAEICNELKVEVSEFTLNGKGGNFTWNEPLKPGACVPAPTLPTGAYTLRFVERDASHAASCNRAVEFDPRIGIRIAADDGSTCIM